MAQPNYGFAKRQRELAKKQKKDEKKAKKLTDTPDTLNEPNSSLIPEELKSIPVERKE